MRNPTHNLPPVITGEGGRYAKPHWPMARGWWNAGTVAGCVLMFLACTGFAAIAANNFSYAIGTATGILGAVLVLGKGGCR